MELRPPLIGAEHDPYVLEEVGRLLASRRDDVIGAPPPENKEYNDAAFLRAVMSVLSDVERADIPLREEAWGFVDALERAALSLLKFASAHVGMQRGRAIVQREVVQALSEVDRAARVALGKRCTWLLGHAVEYTYSAALNDFTACYHRLLELISGFIGRTDKESRITFSADAGEVEKAMCRAWSEGYKLLRDVYNPEDAEEPWCYAVRGRVWMRLGSATGHAMSINLDRGVLEYYDVDRDVNRIMARLWEKHAGLKCDVKDDRVVCTGVNRQNAAKAAAIAAAATSMDLRLRSPTSHWREEPLLELYARAIYERLKSSGLL